MRLSGSIGARMTGVVVFAVTVTILIATAASVWREINLYSESKRAELEATASVFASTSAEALRAGDRTSAYNTLRAVALIPGARYARIVDTDRRIFAELGAGTVLNRDAYNAEPSFFTMVSGYPFLVKTPIRYGGEVIGELHLLVDTADLQSRIVTGLIIALAAGLAAALLGTALAVRWQRSITGPLSQLTAKMTEIREKQEFDQVVRRVSDDETGALTDAFNDMMANIHERDQRLARHRTRLEETVELRTQELREAKDIAEAANAAKSDFLATMSHEIRTPMNGMLVMAELLAKADLPRRQKHHADVIVKSGKSLLTIINDILDLSKIEAGKLDLESAPLQPAALVGDVLQLFWDRAAGKGLDLAGYVAPNVPATVTGDPVRLHQVLSNLVNNAIKFTESGHVAIEVERRHLPDGSDSLCFEISDTGVGIPLDRQAAIFDMFSQADQSTTRRFGGTGLGLAICKRLVGAMGGDIGVRSTPGAGSTFMFTLPVAGAGLRPAPVLAKGDIGRVLVAAQETISIETLIRYLIDEGCEAERVDPAGLEVSQLARDDVLFASSKTLQAISAPQGTGTPPTGPFCIALASAEDALAETLVDTGQAVDVMSCPISQPGLRDCLDRIARREFGNVAPASKDRAAATLPRFAGARVLVAEDNPVNQEVIAEALSRFSIEATIFGDGREAVEAARGGTFDLIFMDCSMPQMDGFEATGLIRAEEREQRRGRVPIVALTAHIAGGEADQWRSAGMDAYLGKPFMLDELSKVLTSHLTAGSANGTGGGTDAVRQAVTAEDTPGETPAPALVQEVAVEPVEAALTGAPETAPAPETDEPPLIDRQALGAIAEIGGRAAGGLLTRVFALFLEHGPEALSSLHEAAERSDAEAVAKAAHALKSMSHNVGGKRLAEACAQLERQARTGAAAAFDDAVEAIAGHMEATLTEIAAMQRQQAVDAEPELDAASG
jgi:two-component system sensor histidine kinase BarA